MKLCPAPVTRSLVAPRTSAASSSSLCGRATCPFAVTLPDQLLHAICLAPASGLKAFAGEKVRPDYILSAAGQRTTKHVIPDINDNMPAPKTNADKQRLAPGDRQDVWQGKRGGVGEDHGGGRVFNKKKKYK